ALPPAITQQDHARRSGLVFTRAEIAPHDRLHSNGLEKIVSGYGRGQQFRRGSSAQQDLVFSVTGKTVKHLLLCSPIEVVWIRSLKPGEHLHVPRVKNFHQARRITVWQRPDQRRIDKSKYGDIG